MKTKASCLIVFLLTTLSLSVYADAHDQKKASRAFTEGIRLFNKGDVDGAVKKFRHADALNPSWKIKYNIGQCEAALKRYGLAIEAFEQYLAEGGDEVPVQRRDEVLAELDRLRRMVGTISIHGEPGVDVYVDIVKRGNTSNRSSIKVTAGVEHQVSFVKDGKKIASINVVVSGGEMVVVPMDSKQPQTVNSYNAPATTSPSNTATAPAAAPAPQQAPPQTVRVVSPAPVRTVVPKPNLKYKNMKELKAAKKSKKITKDQYKKYQAQLKELRRKDLEALTKDYRARKITPQQYQQYRAAIVRKYEGR